MKPAMLPTGSPRSEARSSHEAAPRQAVEAAELHHAWRSTLALGLLGSLLMFLAHPPVDWWPLAWIAPIPWLLLVQQPHLKCPRPYIKLWLAGFLFWMGALHWLRLPHWATGIGWVALSFYLAFYLPLFVGLSRVAVHKQRWSLLVAAPVVWTGLELARAHILSGFTMASLYHTQYRWLEMIQISDLAGGYAVSFVVMLVAACLARTLLLWTSGDRSRAWRSLLPAAAVLAMTWTYGNASHRPKASVIAPPLRVALIQGSFDTQFDLPPERDPPREIHELYCRLTLAALQNEPEIDLVVWPETMFGYTQGLLDESESNEADPAELQQIRNRCRQTQQGISEVHRQLNAGRAKPWNWLVGIDTWQHHYDGGKLVIDRYNSTLMVDATGQRGQRYDKMHPVAFGEYVPLGKSFPWLYQLTPVAGGIESGQDPQSIPVRTLRFSPSICYETVIPHLIRRQVAELRANGKEPDVLVNLTNDGWFWGSSELDMHLACGVFRAVECRKPLVIAANTGFSAHIDGNGQILQQGPRHAEGHLIAEVQPDGRRSPYLLMGDIPAGICLLGCLSLAVFGLVRRRDVKPSAAAQPE